MTGRLEGKVALVTGAARGIGLGIAEAFVREGARTVLSDIRDVDGEAAVARLGPLAEYRSLDVRQESRWEAVLADIVARHSRLDVLVNNAGITGFEGKFVPHDPEHVSLEAWRAVMATNAEGVMLGCKHGLRVMRQSGGGSIVNISSRSGQVGIPGAAAYAASKAAVRNHTKTVALYAAEQGLAVRCDSVHPAAILTPMWEAMLGTGPDRAERQAEMVKDTPLRRFGTVEEVAHLVVYLASDESRYATGTEFNLDGGMLAGSAATPKRSEK
ncbi:MAG TPA: SDR family oxidoreductase [Gemmatimonadales bacterium]|nr:SDR family oxidoreductase [Gemmatimonadales bacterium]